MGALLVWSATHARQLSAGGDPNAYLYRHLASLAIGLALAGIVTRFDYRQLRIHGPVVYLAAVVGLLLVLSPLGRTVNGSHSWIDLGGGFSLQPSEPAKVALCVSLALLLTERRASGDGFRSGDVPHTLGLAAVPIGLVMLQPDLGSAMVLTVIVAGILVIAAVPVRWLTGLALTAAAGAVAVVRLGLLDQYQIDRFAAFANPDLDPLGAGYTTEQARIAIGSGGLTGQGLFHGTQTSGQFVPEQHTDFIFTVAGEELGFAGAAVLLLLFTTLIYRTCVIAARADDLFGALMAGGIGCWFAFQTFVNIGMTLGIMPVTGIPLPFVSYGGSAMLANLTAVGLLQSVRLHQRVATPQSGELLTADAVTALPRRHRAG
ncbi:rod shape-determining protein RodA [Jiangella rhizosphaerae]|uniref:peptidoglycan glycosyltransferase n=2 Tax=Jiangella rhizosphaerae TaxID=2293569 RepID=A0A418KPH1_9ACTN|nr:rod shape-determining protein RodA [Jiangella rhizosphaerae]